MILFTQFNAYFGECPHEDVYVIGVHSGVLADSTTRSTQCSDRMRLVHVDVRLVLLADSMRRLKKIINGYRYGCCTKTSYTDGEVLT